MVCSPVPSRDGFITLVFLNCRVVGKNKSLKTADAFYGKSRLLYEELKFKNNLTDIARNAKTALN
jgi:hypothetical protein